MSLMQYLVPAGKRGGQPEESVPWCYERQGADSRTLGAMALSEQQKRFINWLLTVKEEREPRRQEDLAEELGVSAHTLSTWKRDEEFLREWNTQYLRTIGSPETKMRIMHTLQRTATDGEDPKHVQAAKAFFEIEGSLRPTKAQVAVEVSTKPSELSDADLKRLAAMKAADELARRRESA